jgi:hypothetical protein
MSQQAAIAAPPPMAPPSTAAIVGLGRLSSAASTSSMAGPVDDAA